MWEQVEILRAIYEVRLELKKCNGSVNSIEMVDIATRLHNLYALLDVDNIAGFIEYINNEEINGKKAA